MRIEMFAYDGRSLFRTLSPDGEPMSGQMTAGQLTKRHPQLDIATLLAGAHATVSPRATDNTLDPSNP